MIRVEGAVPIMLEVAEGFLLLMGSLGYYWRPAGEGLEIVRPDGTVAIEIYEPDPDKRKALLAEVVRCLKPTPPVS